MSAAAPVQVGAPRREDRLSYRTIFAYSSLQFSTHAIFAINGVHLLFFYTDTAGLNSARVGFVLAAGHILDAITNPIMGMISDGARWKGGRRRPFFIPGCTITALVWVLLYHPPEGTGDRRLFWYMLALYLLYNTARTAFYIPWQAQAPDLTPHYDERTRLATFRVFFGIPGDVLGSLIPLFLSNQLASQRLGFSLATCGLAVVLIGTSLWAQAGTFELPPPPKPPHRRRSPAEQVQRLKDGSVAAMSSLWTWPTAVVLTVMLMATIGQTFPYSMFRFVTKYYFHDPGMDIPVIVLYQIGAFTGVPAWFWLARRFDKRRAYIGCFLLWIASATPVTFCGPDDARLFIGAMFGIGFSSTGLTLVAAAFAPDIVAWNELHRAGGHEGFFYGFWGFLTPCGQAAAAALIGLALNTVGFVPNVAQSGAVLHGILGMFIVFPAVFLGISAILFLWYPITREVYADVRRQLDERHRAAEAGGADSGPGPAVG